MAGSKMPLNGGADNEARDMRRVSRDSDVSSVSTTSLVFERIGERLSENQRAKSYRSNATGRYADWGDEDPLKEDAENDLETGPFLPRAAAAVAGGRHMAPSLRRVLLILSALFVGTWLVGLVVYISSKSYQHASTQDHDPSATHSRPNLRKMTLDQMMDGMFSPKSHSIRWIAGAGGEDGLLLEMGASGKDFLVVEDVRTQDPAGPAAAAVSASDIHAAKTLIRRDSFVYNNESYTPQTAVPSADLKTVLLATNVRSNWRHSSTALYWIFDVESQQAEPLDPSHPEARTALAQWSPTSDMVVFTRDNNMFLRKLGDDRVEQITHDGGADVFNGVPDWVYEEEVFFGDSTTWWSGGGKYIAFVRTNETGVPEYPIQYFASRPSGEAPVDGEENYPEVRQIKYPKAGAHNPTVEIKLYEVSSGHVFSIDITDDFPDEDRLITDVKWAGDKIILKETNRVSDVMRVILIDAVARTGEAVRTVDVSKIDGGWFEISHTTTYIPADPSKGRPQDGYVDTVIHGNGDHLGYFTPLDNPEPIMLTSGDWEVDEAPSAVDLAKNLVYFVATKESSLQRHVYSVKLDGSELAPLTDVGQEGYYGVSFSSGSGFALLSYRGPNIPFQKVVGTPSNDRGPYEHWVETNSELAATARKYELPLLKYGTIEVDGVHLNYLERRPPHFDDSKQYPVLFFQYSGPNSQQVDKKFNVDFQAYVAASLGYLVVTVDGRGTGFIGRKARVLVREHLGQWESHDQIAAGKHWASLPYVDASRLCIWGWSYGGFMTLKTLEQDAGATFSYGMAVAPVTDFGYYDSIYTERYMRTPQENPTGYAATAITNATALGQPVRFLLMHGVADDNVHMQNSLVLLDRLDLGRVENYDVHVFPDSDHSIYFHNAHRVVYDKLNNWLINAFNGEWLKISHPEPNGMRKRDNLGWLRPE